MEVGERCHNQISHERQEVVEKAKMEQFQAENPGKELSPETNAEGDREDIGEGLERASATIFSGPGT